MSHFALTADPACSIAQAVVLALRLGGHAPALARRTGAVTEFHHGLTRWRGAIEVLDSASAHIAAQPGAASARHLLPLLGLLDQIGLTSVPQDLDLDIFRLRNRLTQLEQQIADRAKNSPPGLSDCLLAAIWWRIGVLDRHFSTFIGLGFAALHRHCQPVLTQPLAKDLLDDTTATLLVARIAASHAVIGPGGMLALWQNGLGPEAGAAQLRH